jgi:oxygen-independent coproporphyrinogen-3 oxidase
VIIVTNRKHRHRDLLRQELGRRMARPQRHRLLQGYPMAPLMRPVRPRYDPFRALDLDPERPLLIGVLPHTFCNPKVRGCGFCTFPHQKFAREPMRRVVEQVANDIEQTALREPSLRERRVAAVYLGGGTANLTPPDQLQRLCSRLASTFNLGASELTLEGVPRYFLLREQAHLDLLAQTDVRHRRISMGVQTFDPAWLTRMGRDAFGGRDDIQRVVDAAHRRGFTASADLLFNLPGASIEHALADVRTAVEIGFDQICAYNLVLNAELDTEWARDDALVRAMPDADRSLATWLAVRESLLERGYVQTTLTNFERRDMALTSRRFVYELASFDPATYDAIGFGPGAISTFTSRTRQWGSKWMNIDTSDAYAQAMAEKQIAVAAEFAYPPADLRLLHLTRNLARFSIDRVGYERFFGTDPCSDFPSHFRVLEEARLVRCDSTAIELTPAGMFYADSVAGLLAHQRVDELRDRIDDGVMAHHHHMG